MLYDDCCDPLSVQEVEEEEDAEHYSGEEAPAAISESKPAAAAGSPPKINEEGAEGDGAGGQSKEESKAEEKGNLAGERQSGDGQVRRDLEGHLQ